MHTYSFSFSPKKLAPERYLVFIDAPVRFDAIPADGQVDIEILHGSTPAAPTVMTHALGKAVGSVDGITIESTVVTISLNRYQLLDNPIAWTAQIYGVKCEVPIHYDFIED